MAPPNITIVTQQPHGFKMAMDRMNVLMTCNSDGTGRHPFLVLGKIEDPHYFWKSDLRQSV